jgi:hypothetical protein
MDIFIFIYAIKGWLHNLNAEERMRAAARNFSQDISNEPHTTSEYAIESVHAIEKFKSVAGLPGYPPATLSQRFFGSCLPMELLFTSSTLVFRQNSSSAASMQTTIPLRDIISARTDYNDGSTLLIKLKCTTIHCQTENTFGARPANKLLNKMLRKTHK